MCAVAIRLAVVIAGVRPFYPTPLHRTGRTRHTVAVTPGSPYGTAVNAPEEVRGHQTRPANNAGTSPLTQHWASSEVTLLCERASGHQRTYTHASRPLHCLLSRLNARSGPQRSRLGGATRRTTPNRFLNRFHDPHPLACAGWNHSAQAWHVAATVAGSLENRLCEPPYCG
jgi:hypothetical protein